jgi:hypothetical protein
MHAAITVFELEVNAQKLRCDEKIREVNHETK